MKNTDYTCSMQYNAIPPRFYEMILDEWNNKSDSPIKIHNMEQLKISAEPVKHVDIRKKETFYIKLSAEGKEDEFINIGATTYQKIVDLQSPAEKLPELPFTEDQTTDNEQQVLQNGDDVRGRGDGRNSRKTNR